MKEHRVISLRSKILLFTFAIFFANPFLFADSVSDRENPQYNCTVFIHAIDRVALERDRAKTEARVIARLLKDHKDCPVSAGIKDFDETKSEHDSTFLTTTQNTSAFHQDALLGTRLTTDSDKSLMAMEDSGDTLSSSIPRDAPKTSRSPASETSAAMPSVELSDEGSDVQSIEFASEIASRTQKREQSNSGESATFTTYREGKQQLVVLVDELPLDDYARVLFEAYQKETDSLLRDALANELRNHLKHK